MKPGEVESDTVGELECEMQSREFFAHIGLLIVEGRVPQCSDKGREEGRHCHSLFSFVSHVCDPAVDSTCQNILEKKTKMEQIWQNGSPMIITVQVCTPSRDFMLLEKWTVEVIDTYDKQERIGVSAQTSCTSGSVLLQAIRSHIHFSQLSAWLSRSKGTIPSKIIYRICDSCDLSPCGTFFQLPDSHVFPLASLQGNKALRVQVESLPRCEVFNFTEEILESKMNHLESNGISSCFSQQKELSEHSTDINDELFRSPLKKKTCLKSHETQQQQLCFENNFTNIHMDYSKPSSSRTMIEEALQRTTRNCDSELLLSQSVFLENFRKKNTKYRSLSTGKAENVQKEGLLNQCSNTNKLQFPSNGGSKQVAVGQSKQQRICSSNIPISRAIPKCRQSLLARHIGSGTIPIFNSKTGLPVSSSPAPLRRSTTDLEIEEESREGTNIFPGNSNTTTALLSKSAPASTTQSLLGNFEESVLNGRMEPLGTVEGFTAELNASGSFCPAHVTLPVEAHFFSLSDDNAPSPYLGYISLDKSAGISKKGYHVPAKGTVQLTLFNPNKTVVKMFVVLYDFSDMPPKAQTFLRQRTFSVWRDSCQSYEVQSSLHYLIHLRFASSKSGRLYLHTDIRLIFARQPPDLPSGYKLCTVTDGPTEPRYTLKHELV